MIQSHKLVYPARIEPVDGRWLASFRDLPGASTDGIDQAEAMTMAADALAQALSSLIKHDKPIPSASAARRDELLVAPDTELALKVALHNCRRAQRMSVADLARALDIPHKECRRLLDPYEPTKASTLERALATLGLVVGVTVYEGGAPPRILPARARPAVAARSGKPHRQPRRASR